MNTLLRAPITWWIASFLFILPTSVGAQPKQHLNLDSTGKILPLKDRPAVINRLLNYRLDNLLPKLMQQSDLDMWLVINREYGEDALFYTLVPQPTFAARRTTILVFVKMKDKVERFSVSRYSIGDVYKTRWQGGSVEQQWQTLADIIADYDPKTIGINVSRDWALADGLTNGLKMQLENALPDKYRSRLTSAENLVIRWLETRTLPELTIYPDVVKTARAVIAEAFSRKNILPGVTTADDIAWFIRSRFEALNLRPWFQPYVTIQRKGDENDPNSPFFGRSGRTVQPGDILHTDVGICYLTLCTDTQEMAYVAKLDEFQLPSGIREAMAKGNAWQDLVTAQFKTGATGNQILANLLLAQKRKGYAGSLYTHPIGFVGHAVGPTIGMWDNQGPTAIQGDWPLYPNTAYAIEGNIKIALPEWNNQTIQIMMEQSAVFDGRAVWYLGGRQTEFHFIK